MKVERGCERGGNREGHTHREIVWEREGGRCEKQQEGGGGINRERVM